MLAVFQRGDRSKPSEIRVGMTLHGTDVHDQTQEGKDERELGS